jgi:hypothetical protein
MKAAKQGRKKLKMILKYGKMFYVHGAAELILW